jgi:hypothetical protein
MINHVVLFKLKKYDNASEKQQVIDEFTSKLLNLKQHIAELKYIEVGKKLRDQLPIVRPLPYFTFRNSCRPRRIPGTP